MGGGDGMLPAMLNLLGNHFRTVLLSFYLSIYFFSTSPFWLRSNDTASKSFFLSSFFFCEFWDIFLS